MANRLIVFMVLAMFSFIQNVYADADDIRLYTEPPDAQYEVIGKVSGKRPNVEPDNLVLERAASILKRKADKLGANALIIESIETIPMVYKRKQHEDEIPRQTLYQLFWGYKIEGTAIKVKQ